MSRGLVLWVCAGVTRKWCYQPGPEGLLYEWWKRGGQCWRPCYWNRVGIPGSGGKQWLRADVEYVLAFKAEQGKIEWADNTACGHPPKYGPGGEMSYRLADGTRKNDRDEFGFTSGTGRGKDVTGKSKAGRIWGGGGTSFGRRTNGERIPPSNRLLNADCGTHNGNNRLQRGNPKGKALMRVTRGTGKTGEQLPNRETAFPVLVNPGNLFKTHGGGGHLGHPLCHLNEAPYPEKLCEFFIKSFAAPGAIVVDPFSGSGTTICVAKRLGRVGLGFDVRMSQCELARRRLASPVAETRTRRVRPAPATPMLFAVEGAA